MNWTKCLGNARTIEAIYALPPSLSQVRVHELRCHQDGPRITIRLDLNEYPSNPPEKWLLNGYNRVQMSLSLINVSSIQIAGWSSDNIGDMVLDMIDSVVRLSFIGNTTFIDCCGQFLEIEDISAYFDSAIAKIPE